MTLPYRKVLRILTILLAISLGLVSFAGAFLPGTYERDSASMAAQVTENDFLVNPIHVIDLAFALPGLVLGSVLLWRKQGILSVLSLLFSVLLFRKIKPSS